MENFLYRQVLAKTKYLSCITVRKSILKRNIVTFRTAVGIRGKDGVVFGVEKLITSKLYESGDNKRILNVDRHVGAVSLLVLTFWSC